MCQESGGEILWEDERCRVIRVVGQEGSDYPGFCRVIWREHVREMSDLPAADRHHLMTLVWATESALRSLYQPRKINLASLGNLVPHLHWHVIPRYADDPLFPAPIWASAQHRPVPAVTRPAIDSLSLRAAISQELRVMKPPGAAGNGR